MPTAIYRHYENKEALHQQVLREGFLTIDHTVEHKVKGALVKDATVCKVFMVDRVRECMAEDSLKRDEPEEVATLLLSTCNGFFGMYVSKKASDTLPEMKAKYERMYRRLLHGLMP